MRKNNPEGVRSGILDAAAKLFQERGYSASSMQHIFERAGVTSGAFYHHFESKKALGLAVIQERVADAVMGTWIAPVQAAATVLDGIRVVFKAIAAELDANRAVRGCPLNNLTLEMAYADADFQQLLSEIFSTWQLELERLLKRDIKNGALHTPSPKRTAALIIAVYSGAMAMSKVQQSADPLRTCLTELAAAMQGRSQG